MGRAEALWESESAPCINNRSFTFAKWSARTTGKAKGESYRANCNQEPFHEIALLLNSLTM